MPRIGDAHPDQPLWTMVSISNGSLIYKHRGARKTYEELALDSPTLEEAEPEEKAIEDMSVIELKDKLRDEGMPVSGNKPELLARLGGDEEE